MFSQHKYPDCRLLYKTEEGAVPMDLHMEVLATSPFFDTFFKWNESIPVKINKRYVNQYTINMTFDISLVELCIKLLYEPADIKELANIDSELYSDILDIIDFLQLDNNIYNKIIELFIEIIYKDTNKCFGCIMAICNSNIEIYRKKAFLARFFYLLSEEEKECIDNKYIPEHIYYGKSFINEKNHNKCYVKNGDSLKYDGEVFSVSSGVCLDYQVNIYNINGLSNYKITIIFFNGMTINKFNHLCISPYSAHALINSEPSKYDVVHAIIEKNENSI